MNARNDKLLGFKILYIMPIEVQNIVFAYLDMDDVTELACLCSTARDFQVVPCVITLPWRDKKKLRKRYIMGSELWSLRKNGFAKRPAFRLKLVNAVYIKAFKIEHFQKILRAKHVYSLFDGIKIILLFDRDFLGIFGPRTTFIKINSKLADGYPAIFHLCYSKNLKCDAWNLDAQSFLQYLVFDTSPNMPIYLIHNIPVTREHNLTMDFVASFLQFL